MNIQIPNELVASIASAADRDGTTIEQIVAATLQAKFGSAAAFPNEPAEKPLTLKDAWADVIGVVDGDGTTLSVNTHEQFANLLAEEHERQAK
jgi:hypothetical protein